MAEFWFGLQRIRDDDALGRRRGKEEECSDDFDMLVEDLKIVADLGLDVRDVEGVEVDDGNGEYEGGEYESGEFKSYCLEHGIKMIKTVLGTLE